MMARYDVNNFAVDTILSDIKAGEIAIPEMQRPFVWDASKVRDLLDSLYKGFPVGYIIVWQNPKVKLKDGTTSSGKKVLIDGQQRITALSAAIAGNEVLDSHYKWKRIVIAFNPLEETFEVSNSANQKSSKWIPDISKMFESNFNFFSQVMDYCQKNGSDAFDTFVAVGMLFIRSLVGKFYAGHNNEGTENIGRGMDTIGNHGSGLGNETGNQLAQ